MADVDEHPAEFAQRFAATLWGDEPSPLGTDTRAPRQSAPSAPLGGASNDRVLQRSTLASLGCAAALLGALLVLGIRTYRGNRRTVADLCATAYGRPASGAQHSVVTLLLVIAKPTIEREGATRV